MYSRSNSFKPQSQHNSSGQGYGGVHQLVKFASRNDLSGIERELRKGEFSNDDYVSAISRAGGFEHMEALKLLTQQPFNRTEDNEKAMRWSARHGKMKALKYFIEVLKVPANCFNSASLRKAAQFGHLNELKYLHQNGADITSCSNEAIKSAVRFYHDDVGEYLINNGADFALHHHDFDSSIRRDVEYQSGTRTGDFDIDRWDLFYRVATKGDDMRNTFKAMLKQELPQIALETAAIKVASYGMITEYKALREHGVCVNAQNTAALSESARFGHKAMLLHLLNDEPELDREVGIQRAIKKGIEGRHDDIVRTLIREVEENSMSISNIGELIDRFLRFKQMSSAKEIIEINPWFVNDLPEIALKIVRFGNADLLKTCIQYGMQILNTEVNYADAALERFNFDNAKVLIEEGLTPSDLNMCMVNSAQFGKADIMTFMLELGARASYNDNEALKKAVEFDHVTSAKILRKFGANVTEDLFNLCRSSEMNDALNMDNKSIDVDIKVFDKQKIAV